MLTNNHHDLRTEVQAKLQEIPQADWVSKMIDHYQRTGTYRPQDLLRLLGDPNRPVEIGPGTTQLPDTLQQIVRRSR